MIRILLPLAVIAAILFAPIYGAQQKVAGIDKDVSVTGLDYVKDTLNCWKNGNFSLKGDCEPQGKLKGKAIFAALFVSGVAAALGVLGMLPFIGRLVSFITTLAGIVVVAAVGYFILTTIGGSKHDSADAVQWGAYLAGGGGLLTLISGLHGVRGGR
ncbi:MAG: hypothetical protein GC153_11325 [Alphaproteobacteria bacterium]|nr:hypothetical protein [Alphaproteobacteria bacterium]